MAVYLEEFPNPSVADAIEIIRAGLALDREMDAKLCERAGRPWDRFLGLTAEEWAELPEGPDEPATTA